MKNIKLSIILLALLTFGQAKAQGLSGSGTTQDPYLITNNADWITFAQSVADGTTYAGQTVKLTADIAANVMAGSHTSETDYHAFSGTFDGDGHTITLSLSGIGHGTALFYHLGDATLKNLKVQGTVTTIGYRPATFASIINGNSTISNCWSTVAVSSSRANDWVDGGGFVGRVSSGATLNMTDCAFHGSVTFAPDATTGGGMVGYTQSNATVNLTNCLYSPTALTLNVSQYHPRIFVSGQESGNLTNCYYNAVAKASVLANQGIDASEMTNEALATALGLSWTITDGLVVPSTTNQYYISSAAEWNAFATALSNGMSFSSRTVNLTADIPTAEEISNGTTAVTTMAGTNATPFAGIFNGQGHTLTVSIVSNELSIAPFRFADGATFQNLKIDGNIDASSKFAAGMLAETKNHSCSFINCISDVTLTSSVNGDGTHGGFVAYLHKGNTTFEGCAFTGKLLGANTTHSGGFVGFTDSRSNASVTFTNCVFHPQQVTMSGTSSQTFARWYNNNSGSVTIGNNCYYSEAFGNAQGKQIHPITSGDYVTVAFDGNATPYELSGIDAYSVGIVYDSTLYAGNGETVSLNLSCTPPSGYTFIGYTATSGTLTGTANPYTLTMPNEAVTIQAVLGQPPVPYIDENGVEQQCTFYTVVTDTLDFYDLPAGWYVVNNDFTHNGPALFFGDAHLILCDGAMMNISYGGSGTAINTYGSLTLYGQSEGTGSLSATSNNGKGISVTNLMTINGSTVTASGGDSQGIYATNLTINGSTVTATGSSIGISSIDLTINGSTVTASANDDGGMGISANRVTINSGTVNATGNDSGIYIGNEYGYVTINGGTVTVTGDYGIYSPTVTLGWSILTDSITVGNFDYFDSPTVSVKSGQAFYYQNGNDTVVISGTLDEDQINAIGGKTLFPYSPPVAYIDENGVEQECTIYTFVTDDPDFNFDDLPAGWYVVNNNITLNNRQVYFTGDAHLILCDGAMMNISVGSDEALYADSSLTLYGQSEGTGSLTTASDENYGINISQNLTINGGTVTATGNIDGIKATNLTINGSTVTASGRYSGIKAPNLTINGSTVTASGWNCGIDATDLTINGSTVTATGSSNGISAVRVTINSGTVNAIGDVSGITIGNGYGYVTINGGTVTTNIIISPTVTLGWSNLNDSITVGSFAYVDTPTVKVKSGQAFYYQNDNETVVVSDTLNSGQISAIGGKTLRPYLGPCASPLNLEVTDIETTTATLHWNGWTEEYEVMYEAVGAKATREVFTSYNHSAVITDLTPNTTYQWKVRGVDCDGNGTSTDWSEWSTFTTLISCWPIDSLSYDYMTSFSVNLSWILEDETQTAWQICLNGDETNLIAADTNEGFLLDDLTSNTEYLVKVRAYCGENDYSSWSNTIAFTTPEVCATPKDFTASNITSVSADLSWTGREDVESYTVRYRSAAYYKNDDDAEVWMIETTPETEAQLTNLSGGTEYEAQVRSDCNPDGWCNMITFTTLDENTRVFVNDGDWDDDNNWIPAEVPTIDNDVILRAEATIPIDCVAEANAITIDSTATLTIEDGGQLKTNANVKATIKKDIDGYGTNNAQTNNGYYLIASPATDSIAAANAGLITAQSDYDLYSWNRTATDEEWHNNHNGIYLQNGVGYLYANRNNMEMNITATLRNSSNPITLTAAYDEEHGGWNLYGNPFPCEVYLSTDAKGMTFYHLVGNEFVPVTDAIAPMEGFFVVATAANQTFTISREGPEQPVHP